MNAIASNKKRMDAWVVITIVMLALYALFMIYPLAILLRNSIVGKDGGYTLANFVQFFSKGYYLETIWNSFLIGITTTAVALIIGVPLAYFYNMYKIRGAGFLQVVIIMCSMSAPFIGAYSWILLLGRNGLITNLIESLTGLQLPSIYGFGGVVLVQALQLFPLVFLYVSGALKNIDNSLLEAAISMGTKKSALFFKVIIPLCAPTIIASTLMVFMRSFADFGTPLFIGEGFRTFPVEIYNSFMSETGQNSNFAAAVSVIAIFITTIIFLFQNFINNKFRFTMNALHPIERKKAHGIGNILMHIFCYGVVIISYAPQLYVIYTSFLKTRGKLFVQGFSLDSYTEAFDKMGPALTNTFVIGILALVTTVVISIFVAYLVVRRGNFFSHLLDTLSLIPYVIPGAVVGISLVIAFNRRPLLLVGTQIIMIISLVIRRNAYTVRSSVATLQQIPMSIEEAATSLGSSNLKTFFKITVPMMANGVMSGALLSWITIITELSAGIILYNYKTITLTIQIYSFVSRGSYGVAAATATILTLMTTLSLLLFMKLSKNKDLTF